jgi:hypothetical protein
MPIDPSLPPAGAYDYRLVVLSVVISTLASYAALDLGGRVTAARGVTPGCLRKRRPRAGLVIISGQHEEVLVVRGDGALERHDNLNLGFPLGLEEDISGFISEAKVPLNFGDVMVAYTDGITEATNCAGVAFGVGRLSEAIRNSHEKSACVIRESVLHSPQKYIGSQHLLDEVSLLVIKAHTL